jgi:hypothetical protein
MHTRIYLLLLACFFALPAPAQDTVLLINGQYKYVQVTELNPVEEFISFVKTSGNKSKMHFMSLKEVYSVTYKDSIRIITYEQDTIMGMELTADQMFRFIKGDQFAMKHYKAPWVTVGGVAAGTAGPLALRAYLGFLVPTAYCGAIGISKVHVRKQQEKYPELFSDEFFVHGYKDRAKHKKIKNAIWGSLAGIGVGLASYGLISVLR